MNLRRIHKIATLLIFETHPVQYRAPVFQELNRLVPDTFEVAYASDFSVRGYSDREFGQNVAWNTPLLQGYKYHVLGNDRKGGIEKWSGLSSRGVSAIFAATKPSAILLHSFGYQFCISSLWNARIRGIPVWIRMETQDQAVGRGRLKFIARYLVYKLLYRNVDLFFAVGTANRRHYILHGVNDRNIRSMNYCTPDPVAGMSESEKQSKRSNLRTELGICDSDTVIGFFGKLIPKKDPIVILEAWLRLNDDQRRRTKLLFVGAGELEHELRSISTERGIAAIFVGFINQLELGPYYLSTDILILPSRQMGETWGLVVNEGLHAGCSVISSDAVGCAEDFSGLERFRVFRMGDERQLASAIIELSKLPRDFNWASETMKDFSVEAAAQNLAVEIALLNRPVTH
jgi:glycosyltransferase involved in cell wall biosynthesis